MTPENAEQLEQLTAYLDGELAPDDRAKIERLLDRDAEARRLLDELRLTTALVGALPHGRAPTDLALHVSARLERQALLGDAPVMARPVRAEWSWANRLALVAAVVMVCTVAWLGWPQFTDHPASEGTFASKDVNLPKPDPQEPHLTLAVKPASEAGSDVRPATASKKRSETLDRKQGRTLEAMGQPVTSRGLVSKARPSDDRGKALTPSAATDDDAASEAPRPAETASVERRLAGNTLNVVELQEAELSKWSNRMVVQTPDSAEAVQLTSFIRERMARNDIPDLAAAGAADAVSPETPFYSFNAADPDKRTLFDANAAGETALGRRIAETPTIVVHVTRPQAEQLLASMQDWAVGNHVEASWVFNGRPVPQDAVAGEVAPQLVSSESFARAWSSQLGFAGNVMGGKQVELDEEEKAGADDASANETPPESTAIDPALGKAAVAEVKRERQDGDDDDDAEERKDQAGAPQPKRAAKPTAAPADKQPPARETGSRRGGNERAASDTTAGLRLESTATRPGSSAVGDSGFVTLAIALRYADGPPTRSAPVAKAKLRRTTTTTQAAPTAGFMGPPAPTSQPTTRESTGG